MGLENPHETVGRFAPELSFVDGGRLSELARDARPMLIDLTEDGAAGKLGWSDRLHVVTARSTDPAKATVLLVRPDGYVAWATSEAHVGDEELTALRATAEKWFGTDV
jgi:hypothetical protein